MSKEDRGKRTRASIYRALFDAMAGQPLSQINVADVATQADVSRGTFYHHFRNLHEALVGMLTFISRRESGRVLASAREHKSGRRALHELTERAWEKPERAVSWYRGYLQTLVTMWQEPDAAEEMWQAEQRFQDDYTRAIQYSLEASGARKLDPEKVAKILYYAVLGIDFLHISTARPGTPKDQTLDMIDTMFELLETEAG